MNKWYSALRIKMIMGNMLAALSLWGVAAATPCPYDISPLPHIEGRVSRVTTDGVMLMDGRLVVLSETLMPAMRQGEDFVFYGLKTRTDSTIAGQLSKFWAIALLPTDNFEGSRRNQKPELICASAHNVQKGAYPGSPAYDLILTSPHHPAPDNASQENKKAG